MSMRETTGIIITNTRGEYLLQERDENVSRYKNMWCLFGGKKDGNEEPIATALRELQEEIGIVFSPDRLTYVGDFMITSPEEPERVYLFKTEIKDNEKIKLGEGAGYAFFSSKEKMLALPSPGWMKDIIRTYF